MYSLNRNQDELKKSVAESYSKPSNRNIDTTGAYNAMIECAEWQEFNGWKKLVVHLINENEQKISIELPYESNTGERMFGANTIDALMVCHRIGDLKEEKDTFVKWDYETKSNVEQDVRGCPELKGKWFHVLLRKTMDAYKKSDTGEIKEITVMTFAGVFQHKTLLSANEIIAKKTVAEEIKEAMVNLENYALGFTKRHKTLFGGNGQQQQQGGGYANAGKQAPLEDDSDLPF
ncbi:hypothetical protein [Acinetobacter phage HFM1]|nr:hypothetical protein [Acinetobacter phage HFM1]